MPGTATSQAEVTNISPHGFWLLIDERELFLPFEGYPWFRRASALPAESKAVTTRRQTTDSHLKLHPADSRHGSTCVSRNRPRAAPIATAATALTTTKTP